MEFDIRSGNLLGDMVKKLSETHHVRTMGSWERGVRALNVVFYLFCLSFFVVMKVKFFLFLLN